MNTERMQVLEILAMGKLTVDEAEMLLSALAESEVREAKSAPEALKAAEPPVGHWSGFSGGGMPAPPRPPRPSRVRLVPRRRRAPAAAAVPTSSTR